MSDSIDEVMPVVGTKKEQRDRARPPMTEKYAEGILKGLPQNPTNPKNLASTPRRASTCICPCHTELSVSSWSESEKIVKLQSKNCVHVSRKRYLVFPLRTLLLNKIVSEVCLY